MALANRYLRVSSHYRVAPYTATAIDDLLCQLVNGRRICLVFGGNVHERRTYRFLIGDVAGFTIAVVHKLLARGELRRGIGILMSLCNGYLVETFFQIVYAYRYLVGSNAVVQRAIFFIGYFYSVAERLIREEERLVAFRYIESQFRRLVAGLYIELGGIAFSFGIGNRQRWLYRYRACRM